MAAFTVLSWKKMLRVAQFTTNRQRQWTVTAPFDARVRELVRDWGANSGVDRGNDRDRAEIARDRMSMADLKLINRSVKEMRYAAKVFAPFQNLRKVAVFGRHGPHPMRQSSKWRRILPRKWLHNHSNYRRETESWAPPSMVPAASTALSEHPSAV
jgi:hypothetical protein